MIVDIVWIDKSGITELVKYAFVAIPLVIAIFYFSTINELKKVLLTTSAKSVPELIKKEFEQDQNIALAIFLAAKFIAITTIVSFSMVMNLVGVILFSVLGYIIQILSVSLVEKMLSLNEPLVKYVIDKQNVPVVILYAGLVIGMSSLIGSLFL